MNICGIVVNYRTPELTARVATALLPELAEAGESHLYIVDNASGDESVPVLNAAAAREGWGSRVTILAAPHNGGYGYGINRAVEASRDGREPPDCYFVLNSDAFAGPGSVRKLVTYLAEHGEVGLCGADIRDTDGVSQAGAFRFPAAMTELNDMAQTGLLKRLTGDPGTALPIPDAPTRVDWISGTCMLIRRQVFEDIGFFDEGFFLYFEEIDFCHRANASGWASFCVPSATVTHLGSISTGLHDRTKRLPRYWFESRHRYFMKHHGRGYTLACDLAWTTGYLLAEAKRRALRRSAETPEHVLRDFLVNSYRLLRIGSTRERPASEGG